MMDDLKMVIVSPTDAEMIRRIEWNKEEFEAAITAVTEQYGKGAVILSGEDMKSAKEDRARLNKLAKAISDRRIEVKKSVMAPYDVFEKEVKEATARLNDVVAVIDKQIKDYEWSLKAEKKSALQAHFRTRMMESTPEVMELVRFDDVFEPSMLNATASMEKAKQVITDAITKVENDLRAITGMDTDPVMKAATLEEYKKCRDLRQALTYHTSLVMEAERQRKAAEARQAEEPQQEVNDKAEQKEDDLAREAEMPAEKPEEVKPVEVKDPEKEEQIYRTAFCCYGTKDQLVGLRDYMKQHGIRFERV